MSIWTEVDAQFYVSRRYTKEYIEKVMADMNYRNKNPTESEWGIYISEPFREKYSYCYPTTKNTDKWDTQRHDIYLKYLENITDDKLIVHVYDRLRGYDILEIPLILNWFTDTCKFFKCKRALNIVSIEGHYKCIYTYRNGHVVTDFYEW